MLKYTLKRLVNAVVVLFVITTATWFLMQLLPGSPIQNSEKLTPEQEAQVAEQYNLDKPLPVQYALYMTGLLRGDLGTSYQFGGRPVTDIILERLPVSLFLGTQAIIIGLVVGLFLGIVSAQAEQYLGQRGGVSGGARRLCSRLRARAAGPVLARVEVRDLPHSLLRELVALRAALARALHHYRRRHRHLYEDGDARGPRPGLRDARKSQGLEQAGGSFKARAQELHDPARYHHAPARRRHCNGDPDSRNGLLHTGSRPAVRGFDLREGFPDHHGHHHTVFGVLRGFVPLTGHPIWDNRPPHTRGRA